MLNMNIPSSDSQQLFLKMSKTNSLNNTKGKAF